MRRALLVLVLVVGAATPAAAEEFVSLYGGWAWQDEDARLDDGTRMQDGEVFGIRFGSMSGQAGGEMSLDINRDGDLHLDSLMFAAIVSLYAHGGRSTNMSFFATAGTGLLRREQPIDDTDTFYAMEYGLGLQFRLTKVFGLRFETLAIDSPPAKIRTLEGTAELAFYW
jgi:opacity protein-like surface antigen